MADKSTNSNNSEKSENADSETDSDQNDAKSSGAEDASDAPVVIEGEAEEIIETDQGNASENDDDAAREEEAASDDAGASEDQTSDPEPLPVVAQAQPEEKRGSVLPLVFGGVVAGGIGFLAASSGVMQSGRDTTALDARFDKINAEIAQIESVDTAPMSAQLDTLSSDLAALKDAASPEAPSALVERIDTLESDFASGMTDLTDRLAAMETALGDMQLAQETGTTEGADGSSEMADRLAAMETTLEDVVSAQQAAASVETDMSKDQLADFQATLDQLTAEATAQVEDAKARATELEMEAAKAVAAAEQKAAFAALSAAVENGEPFSDNLAVFEDAPKALTASADEGVASLSALQRDFPTVARAVLASTNEVPQEASAGERLTAFLKRQTNARSLAPKEGDGVDAILSRAEAHVLGGDLPASLDELAALPDDAKDALAPWLAKAQARLDALNALSELSAAEN